MFAQASELQQNAGQPLFTVVEELIAQIFLDFDVADQQRSKEFLGKRRLVVKSAHHGCFFHAVDDGGFKRRGRAHPKGLSNQGAFSKKALRSEHGKNRFFPCPRHDRNFHLAGFNKENCIRQVALGKDPLAFVQVQHVLSFRGLGEKRGDIRIDR